MHNDGSYRIHGSYLIHYGISGMRWHVRRFQNEDGTLTAAGKERYGVGSKETGRTAFQKVADVTKKAAKSTGRGVKKAVEYQWKKNPKHLTDEELDQRLVRIRKEAEYTRLQREIERNQNPNINQNNQNNGGKNKGGKGKSKHPYLALAILTPIATAIGIATKGLTAEKVNDFLSKRADKKLVDYIEFMRSGGGGHGSTKGRQLREAYEAAQRTLDTAIKLSGGGGGGSK